MDELLALAEGGIVTLLRLQQEVISQVEEK